MMKVIFVCGPWGSGTSVVAEILLRLGCVGLPPYDDKVLDPKTRNSYESIPFRNVLLDLADERTFSLVKPRESVIGALSRFKTQLMEIALADKASMNEAPIVLKHALSCLIVEELGQVFDSKFVFVRRDLDEIEFGRIRRDWSPPFGAEGARKAYAHLDKFLRSKRWETYTVQYQHLLSNPLKEVKDLAKFSNLKNDKESIESAIVSVTRHFNYAATKKPWTPPRS